HRRVEDVDAELERSSDRILVEDVRRAVLRPEIGAEAQGRGRRAPRQLAKVAGRQAPGKLLRIALRACRRRAAGDHLASGAHRMAWGTTRNEKPPLTMWPSVDSTCHSTRQAPGVNAGTAPISRSAAPSPTSTLTGRWPPRSSTTRIVESFFSMRLLKRSEICGGPSLRVAPAAGDDSRSSE